MNENKTFAFDSINTGSDLQFIATNMLWKRNYIYTDNTSDDNKEKIYDYKYTMDVTMTQNTTNTNTIINHFTITIIMK